MSTDRPSARLFSALAVGALAVTALAGCSMFGGSSATHPSSTSSATSSGDAAGGSDGSGDSSASASATASASPTPTPTPTPVTLTQEQVWTSQQVYDFNPNFSPSPSYQVSSGSAADKLVKLSGVSYGWVNESSGNIIEIAVAKPAAETFDQYSGQVAQSAQVVPIDNAPAGTVGYFSTSGDVGTLQVFTNNGYWIVIDSKEFIEPGDAYQIADDVMGNLK
ncbi:hypothetical protein [Gryllotalpicola ginsengisoli]|uniref:hypothetical protein n=1 Tax=Gryllotalpicola ginsengisoli TaxID=444608 RepID=UPI0003B68BE3|nr:hypothetical protein [Gryllotalpicola ginsengisoli]